MTTLVHSGLPGTAPRLLHRLFGYWTDFLTGILHVLDEAAGRLDDVVAMWNIRAARDAAWTNAEVLWHLRAAPSLRTAFFDGLDRITGMAGRGLMVRVRPARA